MLPSVFRMRRFIIALASLLTLCALVSPCAEAQRETSSVAKTRKTKAIRYGGKMSHVAKALKEAGYLSELQAKPRARFYIFFCSASWCGICQQMLPQVIAEYEQKICRRKDVELILLNHDQTPEAGREYMEHHAPMLPGVQMQNLRLESKPTYKYIPACFIMNDKGQLITVGGGDVLLNWEKEIKRKPGSGPNRYPDR